MSDVPRRVQAIDWETWQPVDRATLVFVLRGEQVLLIRKKRGLGAGKINGPGGRLHHGEQPVDAAVREVREELGITPVGLILCGELSFQFLDGYSIHVHVYVATGFHGAVAETDEAVPIWTALDRIPFEEMWEDDRLWIPIMLAGRRFAGQFVFDTDTMVDHSLTVGDPVRTMPFKPPDG